MNFSLPGIPERPEKPRSTGITMVMDKGLSLVEAENLIAKAGGLIDYIKLGFGTSYVTNQLAEKIKLYKAANIKVYLGGTLFEAFYAREMVNDYIAVLDKFEIDTMEISDGSVIIPHKKKCALIKEMAQTRTVLSEVGSKEAGIIVAPNKWIRMMTKELEAGSTKVIAEARESGNVGIYRPNGNAHTLLIDKILSKVPSENILWEAPQKSQQVWFIKTLGANVNLGNIAPEETIPLETLRLGLRGDTFFQFIPENFKATHA